MRKTLERLQGHGNQLGVTLVEVVVAIALFLVVGGGFVYATTVMVDAKDQNYAETKSSIRDNGLLNSFREDARGSMAARTDSTQTAIRFAKPDGSCVRWTIGTTAVGKELVRSVYAPGEAYTTTGGVKSTMASDVQSGKVTTNAKTTTLEVTYTDGKKLSETVKYDLVAREGGTCW